MNRISLPERELRQSLRGRIARFLLVSGLLALLAVIFCACAGETLLAMLGFDVTDYGEEQVLAVLDTQDARAEALCGLIRMMASDPLAVPEFSGSREAMHCCGEAVLSHLLCTGGQRAGGTTLRAKAAELYPNRTFTNLISAAAYEHAFYRCFGGQDNVSHRSDGCFTYLSKLGAYTTVVEPHAVDYAVEVLGLEETAHAYRMTFRTAIADYASPPYLVIFVKREDGSCYIRSCEQLKEV